MAEESKKLRILGHFQDFEASKKLIFICLSASHLSNERVCTCSY